AVVQGASHRSHLHTASSGRQAGVEGNSWLASLEVGQSFALSSNWQIQPQAQLIYSKMSLDDTALQQTDVKHHTKGDWTMRLGARMQG
ncbi:autotransporter domain-containing protein, partial [Staphylococcus aureus]|nr:autotransporter domain-containing protein [Staphylococcus aureus]